MLMMMHKFLLYTIVTYRWVIVNLVNPNVFLLTNTPFLYNESLFKSWQGSGLRLEESNGLHDVSKQRRSQERQSVLSIDCPVGATYVSGNLM